MTAGRAPLAGVRVLDMGWSWAGPYGGMILADLGAEVIKLETSTRIDVLRWSGAFADGVRGYERSGYHGACNRGKLSCTLNLKHPAAHGLLLELVSVCDVVIENFAPRVLPNLGLPARVMLDANPRLIVLSMAGYGARGPERDYLSYGDHLLHSSGIASITGAEDDPHTKIGTFYGDPVGGMYGALGVLAALAERDRTGAGRHLELSQLTGLVSLIPGPLLRSSLGLTFRRSADKSADLCPNGFYRCAGEDAWVALAVRSDPQWQALRALMGDAAESLRDYDCYEQRRQKEVEIDAAISKWTGTLTPWEATRLCQQQGVSAYPVLSAPGMLRDDHLASRRFFRHVHHPVAGPGPIPGMTFQIAGADVRGPAPLLGQHNDYVYGEILGLPVPALRDLVEAGAVV